MNAKPQLSKLARAVRVGVQTAFGPFVLLRLGTSVSQSLLFSRWSALGSSLCAAGVSGTNWTALGRRTVLAGAALPVAACAAFFVAQTVSRFLLPQEGWVTRQSQMVREAVVDQTGLLIGFDAPDGAGDLETAYAVKPDAISEACIDLVIAQEDRHFAAWWHQSGVDLGGLVRGVVGVGGGSTLAMQLTRLLRPEWNSMPKLVRKSFEVAAAGTIHALHRGDEREIARAYLTIAPLGLGRGEVKGLAAAADVFFATRASTLTPSQCAALIVQLPRPLRLDRREDPDVVQAWRRSLVRANRLLAANPNAAYRAAASDLVRWQNAIPIRPAIADAGEAVRLNLGARTRAFVTPQLDRIRKEAQEQERPDGPAERRVR